MRRHNSGAPEILHVATAAISTERLLASAGIVPYQADVLQCVIAESVENPPMAVTQPPEPEGSTALAKRADDVLCGGAPEQEFRQRRCKPDECAVTRIGVVAVGIHGSVLQKKELAATAPSLARRVLMDF